jgi:hypothetical protein
MGIENTKERLRLYYANNFELSIIEENGYFLVDLNIKV